MNYAKNSVGLIHLQTDAGKECIHNFSPTLDPPVQASRRRGFSSETLDSSAGYDWRCRVVLLLKCRRTRLFIYIR